MNVLTETLADLLDFARSNVRAIIAVAAVAAVPVFLLAKVASAV